MGMHPSTPAAAPCLLAAGAALTVVALVLALAQARLGLVMLPLGAGLGLVLATNTLVTGARRQWARRGDQGV